MNDNPKYFVAEIVWSSADRDTKPLSQIFAECLAQMEENELTLHSWRMACVYDHELLIIRESIVAVFERMSRVDRRCV